jgi:hypothetical protein
MMPKAKNAVTIQHIFESGKIKAKPLRAKRLAQKL